MTKPDRLSDSEMEDTPKVADPATCLDYLKRREVFLYKMMNDPHHRAMLYFLEVLMNSESPLTVSQLAERFTNKAFSPDMREACGGGTAEALKEFLLKYPALFSIKPNGLVSAVAIEMPGFDEMSEASLDLDNCFSFIGSTRSVTSTPSKDRDSIDLSRVSSSSSKAVLDAFRPGDDKLPIKSALKSPRTEKSVGIYQPPMFRAGAVPKSPICCDLCSMAASLGGCSHVATTSATTIVHCPYADYSCSHVQPQSRYHAAPTKYANHCCHNSSVSESVSCCHHGNNKQACPRPFAPINNFELETEAVKFFQQRLSVREERWIPVRSLAGHLSQASLEIRSIVGPQLEFRRFLLKHPHVFEVQGDLVGLKDPFTSACLSRRPRSFINRYNSASTNSLSASASFSQSQKMSRPKSLIMLAKGSAFSRSTDYYSPDSHNKSGSASSAPTTPTGQEQDVKPDGPILRPAQVKSAQVNTVTSSSRFDRRKQGACPDVVSSTDNTNSICIRMSADEYRAIMFLRKVLTKKGGAPGQAGLSYSQLMKMLTTKAPESVQSAIGWTRVELEEFVRQHPIFFEILEKAGDGDAKSVANRRVLKMINIVITGNRPTETGTRTLTNRCGRAFHVAKLWGIIDLGKHEHVFFDKSILKYVDDLQKHFKVNELLYFNAILAPKDSRAKWRATQVWKECDREIMEKLAGPVFSQRSSRCSQATSARGVTFDSDSDYGLGEDEDINECDTPASALARSEGLHLANDIKFLSDDVEEELQRILGPQDVTTTATSGKYLTTDYQLTNYLSDDEDNTSIPGCLEDISVNFSDGSEKNSLSDTPLRSTVTNNMATSTTNQKPSSTHSSEGVSERLSIAVQTLSTGDIMATQIFHDH